MTPRKAAPEYERLARLVGRALGLAEVGVSARGVRRATNAARCAIESRVEKLADDDSAESLGETACLFRLLDICDALEQEGVAAAFALLDEEPVSSP